MIEPVKLVEQFRVKPGGKFRIHDWATSWAGDKELKRLSSDALQDRAKKTVQGNLDHLAEAQELLYANDCYSVLLIFQAMDAAGKDGMIKHVMSGLNPQGCQVFAFKRPSEEEVDHNFLWRYSRCLPERGRIGIFNRSYYEETLVVRVHPEYLQRQRLPKRVRPGDIWEERFEDINHFEKHLHRSGTLILKFYLHLSKDEQKKRLLARLEEPEKHWKFNSADLDERALWHDYMGAYEKTIEATSTSWAPWFVIPADHKWIARAMVSGIVSHAIAGLGLKPLRPDAARLKELVAAKRRLQSE